MSQLKRKDVLFKLEGIEFVIPPRLSEEDARWAIVNVLCKRG
jgi:hypothetical protein